jgi:hypothetical protein
VAKIVGIITVMIGLVIGANLINPINTATSVIITPTYSAAVVSLSALLPLLFVVILMIFAVKAID